MIGTVLADDAQLLIGMPDIAMLAKVQRSVVSVWRRRFADDSRPFPSPLGADRGRDIFDAAEVARWLSDTGHGNNPLAMEDVAAFAVLATVSDGLALTDRSAFETVTAALCLRGMLGQPLSGQSRDELLDLADAHDPDDEFLYTEFDSAGDRLVGLTRYGDLLADAAVSPAAAFEQLMADRFRSGLSEHASTAVRSSALSLVARIAVELTLKGGLPVTYADPLPGSSDLLISVLTEHGDRGPVEVLTPRGDQPSVRLVRRRLRVHGVYREGLRVDENGVPSVDRAVTHVTQLPSPARTVMTDAQMLAAIEQIAVQMDHSQRAVVLAPASALSDGFGDPAAAAMRDALLRAGHVQAIVRLPKGLVPTRPRQALGLWVLGPASYEETAAERFTLVADLANEVLTDEVADSLLTDLVAATGSRALARAHTFRFVRPVPTRTLLTARRSLMATAMAPRPLATRDATALVQVQDALADLDTMASTLALPAVELHDNPDMQGWAPLSLAAMLGDHHLRVIPGNRLNGTDIATQAGLRVIGVEELTGDSPAGHRAIDPLVFAAGYEAGRLTEPGDVIFCTSPTPSALVDREGASVVAFPARTLRIDPGNPGGLHPELLAADVNAEPATAREWLQWPVRRVRDDQRACFGAVCDELRRARDEARTRLAKLDALTQLLTDGVANGVLRLKPTADSTRGR